MDMGDHVVIVNADKIVVTSDKAEKKVYYRHSGYPGGISKQTLDEVMATKPEEVIRKAVRGMIPKTRLGRAQIKKLKIYAGPDHPHSAQQPQVLDLAGARRPA